MFQAIIKREFINLEKSDHEVRDVHVTSSIYCHQTGIVRKVKAKDLTISVHIVISWAIVIVRSSVSSYYEIAFKDIM